MKNKNYILPFLLVLFCLNTNAQTQTTFRTFHGTGPISYVSTAIETLGGGAVTLEKEDFDTASFITVTRYDAMGGVVQESTFENQAYYLSSPCIRQTTDNGYIFCNRKNVFKVDANFNAQWAKTLSMPLATIGWNEAGAQIIPAASGGQLVVSDCKQNTLSIYGLVFAKMDENDNVQWSKVYYHPDTTISYLSRGKTKQTTDEGYISVGRGGNIGFVMKTDSLGNIVWNQTIMDTSASNYISLNDVIQLASGEYFIVGETYNTNSNSGAGLLIKISSIGNIIWAKVATNASINIIVENASNGHTMMGYGNSSSLLIDVDSMGNVGWAKSINQFSADAGYYFYLSNTSDGGYFMGGARVDTINFTYTAALRKADINGNAGCNSWQNTTLNMVTATSSFQADSLVWTTNNADVVLNTYSVANTSLSFQTSNCFVVGTNKIAANEQPQINIYPNPTQNIARAEWRYNTKIENISISDIQGRILQQIPILSELSYDLSLESLPLGVYFVQFWSQKGLIQTMKLIKMN